MTQPFPPGQGPIDPRAAFSAPPPPPGGAGPVPGFGAPGPVWQPPGGFRPMMPPFMPYPPPGGGAGRTVLLVVLVLILLGSVVMNFILGAGLLATAGLNESGGINEIPVASGAADQQVAIVPLDGIITDDTRRNFDRLIDHVNEVHGLKTVVLDIDSPGGEVTPSDEIYERILKLKSDHPGLIVVASIRGMGASGAYYAACAADHLVVEETGITGSIGVLWPNYNFSALMQKYGVSDQTIVATGATFKDAGSPTQPRNPEIDSYLHGLVDGEFARFKSVVVKSRASHLTANIEEIADGKAYSADEAKRNGLIDQVGDLDAAVSWAESAAKLSSPNVVRYEERTSLLDRLPFAELRGKPESLEVNLHGMHVSLDTSEARRLLHPRPMMLLSER